MGEKSEDIFEVADENMVNESLVMADEELKTMEIEIGNEDLKVISPTSYKVYKNGFWLLLLLSIGLAISDICFIVVLAT